jgi:hypothetical protein
MAGSLFSGDVLMLGRSKALRMDGRRKQSVAWGRGRMDVDAVVARY